MIPVVQVRVAWYQPMSAAARYWHTVSQSMADPAVCHPLPAAGQKVKKGSAYLMTGAVSECPTHLTDLDLYVTSEKR